LEPLFLRVGTGAPTVKGTEVTNPDNGVHAGGTSSTKITSRAKTPKTLKKETGQSLSLGRAQGQPACTRETSKGGENLGLLRPVQEKKRFNLPSHLTRGVFTENVERQKKKGGRVLCEALNSDQEMGD